MKKESLLNNDLVFKSVFKDETTIKRLLEETLNLKINKLSFTNTELDTNYNNEKSKTLDLIIHTDKGIINVEVNNGYMKELNNRNLAYFCKLFGSSLDKNKNYCDMPNHIQLNLTWNLSKYINYDISNREKIEYFIVDKESGNNMTDVFRIVTYNMDYYLKKWKDNDYNVSRFMMLLTSPSTEDMKKISKGDKLMKKIADKVYDMNYATELALHIAVENEHQKIVDTAKIVGYREGHAKGIKKGHKEGLLKGRAEGLLKGRAEGRAENCKEITKKLLNMKYTIEDISIATGLSEDEINDIKKTYSIE